MSGILHARLKLLVATSGEDEAELGFDDEPTQTVATGSFDTRTLALAGSPPAVARNDNTDGDSAGPTEVVELVVEPGDRFEADRRAVIAERARVDAAGRALVEAERSAIAGEALDEVAEEIEEIDDSDEIEGDRRHTHAWRRPRATRMQN